MTTTHDLPDGHPASPVDEGRALAGRWTIGARYGRRGEVHFHHATDANGPVSVAVWRYRGFEPLPRFLVHLGHDREAWSAVRTPGVARTLDIGREVGETTCFWVVRSLQAVFLSEHLAMPGSIDRAKAVSIAMQVGDALAGIHSVGLVHGAVRPDTVLLDGASGRVQLAWGGLVPRLARAGVDVGHGPDDFGATAPEILSGGSASAETDVYGLAALLFTLLHDRPPFAYGESPPGTDPDLPGELADLLERSLRRDADLRPAIRSFTEHLEDLAAAVGWDVTDRPEDPPPLPPGRSVPPPADRRTSTATPPTVHRTIDPEARRVDRDAALANTPTSAGRRVPATPVTLSSRSVEPRADHATFGVPILSPSPTRLQTTLIAAVLLLAVTVAAMGSAVWLLQPSAPAALPAPPQPLAPVAAPVPSPPTLLAIRTEPPGAEVWDGETLLGTTPLELPLGSSTATRTLEIRAEGYATHTIVQPASPTSVQHNVVLQRAPARSRPPDLELREQR